MKTGLLACPVSKLPSCRSSPADTQHTRAGRVLKSREGLLQAWDREAAQSDMHATGSRGPCKPSRARNAVAVADRMLKLAQAPLSMLSCRSRLLLAKCSRDEDRRSS